jgi:cytochrome c oxidase accessory protein FixG
VAKLSRVAFVPKKAARQPEIAMADENPLLSPEEHLLSTMNQDGSRRWVRPRIVHGKWWKRRAVVAWSLILIFNILPWIKIAEKPLLRLDVVAREFTFFTVSFRPTETLLLTLLLLIVFLGIFLMTALFGRVWCGWGCPQTIYLEYLFRPLEKLICGPNLAKGKPVPIERRVMSIMATALVCLHLSHTFLAYFAGPQEVLSWSLGSPGEHPTGFAIVIGVTALMMFDFLYFREQMCILACPYGRLQSVLLDRKSLIVGYDEKRGEPRGKLKKAAAAGSVTAPLGDCIDCGWCSAVCPTGIDIRKGLQMECIHCTECIDACDTVMDKIEKPRGLIRYSSQDGLEGGQQGFFRPRVVLYPLVLAIVISLFVWQLSSMQSAILLPRRVQGQPFTIAEDGRIRCLVTFRLENRSGETRTYQVESDDPRFELIAPTFPMLLADSESRDFTVIVLTPPEIFDRGTAEVPFRFQDGVDFDLARPRNVAGPYSVNR